MAIVIIPAYNEEKIIGRVIRGLFEQGLKDIIVVDDGSADGTAAEAAATGVIVLRHEINRGQGAALETGDAKARLMQADMVVHFDGDDQFNPADIRRGIEVMNEKKVDVVLGSRFLDSRSHLPWPKRKIILPISRWVNFVFTGCLLTDAHNGFRILSKNALEKVRITHDRMAHNTEVIRQIRKLGLSYLEFPVEVRYHTYGQGVVGGVAIVRDLLVGLFTKFF
ncbi:MAG: glycosyltransferase family 2 protein [Patescibacteria group bacterium]